MNELHEEIGAKLLESLQAGVSDEAMKRIKKSVDEILYEIEGDIDYRLKDDLAPNLVAFVCDMAERTVKAILDGNESEMRRYLGCDRGHWTGRSDSPEYGRKREMREWHPVIHGELFEQGAVRLRHEIVAAHSDLIRDERIKDLEDQVASLVEQVNKANREREAMFERVREYG